MLPARHWSEWRFFVSGFSHERHIRASEHCFVFNTNSPLTSRLIDMFMQHTTSSAPESGPFVEIQNERTPRSNALLQHGPYFLN